MIPLPPIFYRVAAYTVVLSVVGIVAHSKGYNSAVTKMQARQTAQAVKDKEAVDAALAKQKETMQWAFAAAEIKAREDNEKAVKAEQDKAAQAIEDAKLNARVKTEIRTNVVYRDAKCAITPAGIGLWDAASQGNTGANADSIDTAPGQTVPVPGAARPMPRAAS